MRKGLNKTITILILAIFIMGCNTQNREAKNIKLVTSNWIGYAPLIYAYENGDLDNLNIELVVSTSLQSSVLMYEKNKYDGICSTKKEIEYINSKLHKNQHITPIAIFNRSYGGDVILSNFSKEDLYNKPFKKMEVFLEKDSINEVVFKSFKKMNNWKTQYNINYINQYNLIDLNCNLNGNIPQLLITYEPYATKLKQKGYHLIESTKNDNILVFDFLSINDAVLTKKQIRRLQHILNKSIKKLQENPKDIFNVIKFYYDDMSYGEFESSLEEIQLFSKQRKEKFISLLKKEKICTKCDYLKEQ